MKQNPYSESFVRITAAVLAGQAGGAAITVGVAALIFNLPLRRMVVPYAMFICPGIVFAPLVYWVRISRANPRVFETREAIALSVYVLLVALALVFSALWLGVVFRPQVGLRDALLIGIVTTVISIGLYAWKRRRPGAMQQDLGRRDKGDRKEN
jgi:hypothetical protein